ncbi:MAG: hypothetical protein AAGF72_15780, partial [Pseudomonadota bacterium]
MFSAFSRAKETCSPRVRKTVARARGGLEYFAGETQDVVSDRGLDYASRARVSSTSNFFSKALLFIK